ncbi:MAG: 3-hydroxybutyryl-CoA dehydrogenase [Saprospiraceae bacterium]|nr:3-hydroxybutyryl-CoA dehydrogenase [Saprospiraceae bacterium]
MQIGIVGSGAMGSGIAQVAAQNGCQVILFDTQQIALDKALGSIEKNLDKAVEKGKMTEGGKKACMANLKTAANINELANCDWVIEAIIEDLTIKKQLFRDLEDVVSDNCILATNTSSLSVTALASACRKPERVLGIHFFNPPPLMALVEVIPALQTDADWPHRVCEILKTWKKTPVLAKDTPGFIVNRIARPFYSEALRIYDEGIADMATIDWAMTYFGGFKMGPFALMDFIGHDINYRVTEGMFFSFFGEPRYKPSFTQKRLFDAGFYGRKVGKGFFDYNQSLPEPIKDVVLGQKIFNRILSMLINEAADALFWNIASADDIDLAMTKGVNYPKGLLAWGAEMGYETIVEQLDDLYDFYHEERYRCSPYLRQKIKK